MKFNLDFVESFINVIDDSFIEILLTKVFIDANSHENDKQIIEILIENDKKLHFRLFRCIFLLSFLIELAYIVDNAEDKVLLKIFSTASIVVMRPLLSKKCRMYEKEAISLLEKSVLTKFNKKVKNVICKDIEEYNYNDNIIKNIYLDTFHNILDIFESYTRTINGICTFSANILILVFFYPLLFKLKYGVIQNIFNIGFVIIYQIAVLGIFQRFTTKNKNNRNTQENELKNMIYSLFQNMDIVVESDSLKNELNKIIKHIEKMVSNDNILSKYANIKTAHDYVKSMKYYKIMETVTSIIINDTSLLFFTEGLKSKIVDVVDRKKELYKKLNFGHNIVTIINMKDYQISKPITWNNENDNGINQHAYLFVLEDVSINYKTKSGTTIEILNNINVKFELSKSHFLYGNSGCGKTTLMNALVKKVKSESGTIKFLNTYTYTYFGIRNYLTYLTSESALFPESLYYNIIYGIHSKKLIENNEEITETINKYVNLFGLEKYLKTLKKTKATNLSKGEKQRVAIIRLIIGIMYNDTRILFLDEYTSNIDNVMEEKIYSEIRKLQKIYHFTMFYVSHNLYNMKYADFKYEIDTNNHSIHRIDTTNV